MAQLALAPNAVVILNHLCYASGDTEWGQGVPTQAVAEQRVDGYASGFLRGGAKAVIAEGVDDIGPYIDGLFTAHSTIDSVWKSFPGFHNHVTSWASHAKPRLYLADRPHWTTGIRTAMFIPIDGLDPKPVDGRRHPARRRGSSASRAPTSGPPTRVVDTAGNGIGPQDSCRRAAHIPIRSPARRCPERRHSHSPAT